MDKYIGVFSTILGFVISYITTKKLEEIRVKKTLILENYNRRNIIIKDVYLSLLKLKKYYELFYCPRNEFIEQRNYTEFGPLEVITDFKQIIENNELFLSNETVDRLYGLTNELSMGCSIALHLQSPENSTIIDHGVIVEHSERCVDKIQRIMDYLKIKVNEIEN